MKTAFHLVALLLLAIALATSIVTQLWWAIILTLALFFMNSMECFGLRKALVALLATY